MYSEYLLEKRKSQKGLIFFTESSASFCLWGSPAGQIYGRQCPRWKHITDVELNLREQNPLIRSLSLRECNSFLK